MALVLKKFAPIATGKPVYHFAPERSISNILASSYGEAYTPADYAPEEFAWLPKPAVKVDLSAPLDYLPKGGALGLVHSHVLEHIPAPIDRVIEEMNAAIVPGGFHIFQVPIDRGWYREDMNPEMPPAERENLFHQHDHLRVFGRQDFEDRCLRLFGGFERIDLSSKISSSDLLASAIPSSALTEFTGHSVFMFRKPH